MSATPPFRANIAVCGKFHLFNYVPYIRQSGHLNRFYYSHYRRVERDAHPEYVRLPLKELLIQGHGLLLGDFLLDAMNPVYASIWRRSALARWTPADILHFVLLGHSLPLVRRARGEGAVVIADAVSTHPEHRRLQLSREAERWGIARRYYEIPRHERHIDEELADADLILTPSHHVAGTYAVRFPGKPTAVIPYATNIDRFYPPEDRRIPDGPLRILIVGRIGLRKGQLYVLEAASRMRKGSVAVTLVGTIDPAVAGRLECYRDLFTHVTRIANDELVGLHHCHDVFMLTSVEEGLAVSICEAMGSGMAVACTAETGVDEIVTDGVDGYVLPSGSVEAIVEFLDFAVSNRATLIEVGTRAAARAAWQGNWRIYADRLLEVYARAMSAKPAT